jgi:hypothetical protein
MEVHNVEQVWTASHLSFAPNRLHHSRTVSSIPRSNMSTARRMISDDE